MKLLKQITGILLLLSFLWIGNAKAQSTGGETPVPRKDSALAEKPTVPPRRQTDLVDIAGKVFGTGHNKRMDTGDAQINRLHISAVPAVGYTLLTGFAAIVAANAVFRTDTASVANASDILTSVTYSQYRQIIIPIQSDIWTKNSRYNIISDWRFLQYPSYTYGLGGYTKPTSGYYIDYSYLRFYQAISRYIASGLYAGVGYDLDYAWNIKEINPPPGKKTSFERYGYTPTETASGITLNLLYDTRKNPINPDKGTYAHIVYRPNFTFMGSDRNWQSLQIDLRDYIRLPASSDNVLAFWSFDWLTLKGKPPYLFLPSTGWDTYNNTGRGYIQGRFRGREMLYLESEYRFGITRNGLLGGVVFANAQSFSQAASKELSVIAPGWGAGIRIRLNKFSKTNLAVDYGFGTQGSQGFAVNLGEVF